MHVSTTTKSLFHRLLPGNDYKQKSPPDTQLPNNDYLVPEIFSERFNGTETARWHLLIH